MSTAPTPPTALHLVADGDDPPAGSPGDRPWRTHTVIDEYSPEHQFVGSLMWLSATRAHPLLELVPESTIWRPHTRWAYQLIGELVRAGTDPTPASVLAAGRHQPARDAIDPTAAPTPAQHKQLALYLFDAYAQALAPATAITSYAREVLAEAYRRAYQACGIRMQELAASGADPNELAVHLRTLIAELDDLRHRTATATTPHRTGRP